MAAQGILSMAKPPDQTSMDIVRAVKRLTRERRVGHGGTLDPLASGVLPICLGRATRLMDYLVEGRKTYRAQVLFGIATDTYDATGQVAEVRDASGITVEALETALGRFQGVIQQVPPMFSALKRGGQRLYDLARAGMEVPREPRKVRVHRLELVRWEPPTVTLEVECGRGLYIRALAHDLGQALGCGAHLTALVRLKAGPFALEEATSLEELAEAARRGDWQELLYPVDFVLLHLWAAVVGTPMEAYIRQGQQVALGHRGQTALLHGERCRVYTLDGRFMAILRLDRALGQWQPEKVLDTGPAQ
jgi:tRNA pseudouridine55 synthase